MSLSKKTKNYAMSIFKSHLKPILYSIAITLMAIPLNAQIVGPYTGIDFATDYTNPSAGGACDMTFINAAIGYADFVNGAAEVPMGWSFSGTWNSGTSYLDGPGDELLLVSLHTYTESWYVALRLSDGTTTASLPYDLTLVTSNAVGTLAVCGGVAAGPFDYERPSQLVDFADFAIPVGVGVIGIVFEPFADGAVNPDPHGVMVLEGTPVIDGCEGPEPTARLEFVIGGVSSEDGATGACISTPIQFNDISSVVAPGEIISWNWNFGDGSTSGLENPVHTYGVAGTYTVTLTVTTEGGCTDTYSTVIVMTNGLAIDLTFNEPTCFGFADGSVTVTVLDVTGDLIFTITDADGTVLNEDNSNTANTLPTGWYYINVDDDTDCSGLDSIFLDQPGQLDMSITVTDPLCYGLETGWERVDEVLNYTGSEAAISYFWTPNPADNNGIGADSTWSLGAGEYTLTINDENGCSRLFDFVVIQPDSLFFTEFGFDPAYCRVFDYQSGNGVVFGAVAGGTPDFTYTWENLETGETINNTTWGGLNPANYLFTATDANGCVKTGQLFLDSLNPIAAFTVISDQLNGDLQGTAPIEVVFENNSENFANPNNPLADTTFFWNLNNPIASWEFSGSYFETFDTTYGPLGQTYEAQVCLVAINKNGCSDTACKIITIFEPITFTNINIFSPNNDGKNDLFTFDLKSASIKEFTCVIVNRWGDVIYEMNDVADGWDGTTVGGSICSAGVYFYTYEALTDNNTKIVGQ